MDVITVGAIKNVCPFLNRKGLEKRKKVEWKYGDIPVNKKGWTVDLNYRPHPFDICALLIEGRPSCINGWWTGIQWTALRLRSHHKIIGWKFIKELN